MFSRGFRLPLEVAWFGPLYATIRWRIRKNRPLDPYENWEFWSRSRSGLVQSAIQRYPPCRLRSRILRSALKRNHEEGIEYHYELPREFFELFLDREYLFYSCGDFLEAEEDLGRAQRNKADFLLNLIEPKRGEKILDLGCGWGGMMQAIFESTGDRGNLLGFTLSREQVRYVQDHLGFQVSLEDFVTVEYEPGSWSKIYSIGAWEHVKPEEIVTVLRKLHRALKPDGRLVQHFFCLNRRDLPTYMIAGQVFFPGSQLVSWEEQVEAFRLTGFTMRRHTTHDYRPTLEAWYWNLANRADEALQIVDLQTYNQFLTFFPLSWRFFNEGVAQVHRFLLLKET